MGTAAYGAAIDKAVFTDAAIQARVDIGALRVLEEEAAYYQKVQVVRIDPDAINDCDYSCRGPNAFADENSARDCARGCGMESHAQYDAVLAERDAWDQQSYETLDGIVGVMAGTVGGAFCGGAAGVCSGAIANVVTKAMECSQGYGGNCSFDAFFKSGTKGAIVGGLLSILGTAGSKAAKLVLGKFAKLLSDDSDAAAAAAAASDSSGAAAASEAVDAMSAVEPDLIAATDSEIGDLESLAGQDSKLADQPPQDTNPAGKKTTPTPKQDTAATSPGTKTATPATRTASPVKVDPVAPKPEADPAAPPPGCAVHSFTGTTQILMADSSTTPIDHVKIGDHIADAVPGQADTQDNTVTNVIITTTDHDFVSLDIKPLNGETSPTAAAKTTGAAKTASKAKSVLTKVATGLAATVTALGAVTANSGTGHSSVSPADAPGQGGTLTTTFHHPFYNITQAAFVDAQNLKPGDELQTPTGHAVVAGIRLYHANTVTYDLTIGNLHTYYVVAGSTPVLVHNCNGGVAPNGTACACNGSTNPSTPDLIQAIATRAETRIGGTGRFAGTSKHTYAQTLLDRYQGIYGNRGLVTEQDYLAGQPVPPYTRGAARPDVYDTTTGIAYDYKFTQSPPGLTQRQIDLNAQNVPGIYLTVEVNP